jgi:flagellar motor protein MotB
MSRAPAWGLPDYNTGGVYVPRGQKQYGIQTTAGIDFNFGPKYVPAPPPPPPPPAPRKPEALANLSGGGIEVVSTGYGPSNILCQGRPIRLRSTASDPAGRPLTYRWTVNGQPSGGNSAELSFTPDRPGNYVVAVDVTAPNAEGLPERAAKGGPMTLNVQEYRAPTVTGCTANPATTAYGNTVNFSSTGAGSPCSSIKYLWTVTEGTLSNTSAPTTSLDTKTLRFEQSGKIQTKTVTATATVTDDRGASARCTASTTVTYTPQAIRFGDLIFSKNGARVNNCAKRILLEEVAPRAADQDYEVVLVGHVDNDEARRAGTLDRQRVQNAAAVLSGGTGTCAKVDPGQIKVDWVGTDQTADKQPGLCGTSARVATKERSGSVVSAADENRRVEVWLVPKGTAKPASFKAEKTLDPKVMKTLGCPK